MSFHEISIAIRAENRATPTFRALALDVANLGVYFGFLSNEQAKAVSVMFTVIRTVKSLSAIVQTVTSVTWLKTAAETAAGIATWIHAHAQLTLIAALTFGVGAIIAVTAALWAMAEANRAAAQSVNMLNSTMMESSGYGYGYGRNIERAGEEALRRRAIE